jgi:hypothetical protein
MEWEEGGAKTIMECDPEIITQYLNSHDLDTVVPLIGEIEESVHCGGLCTKQWTYILAGISLGPPPSNCV